jgi:hypothetical protein
MTITSTQNRVSYAGNGAPGVPGTLAFSVPFRFLAISDLVVLVRVDATGADTTKTLDTHYSVSGEGAATGGTVTFLIEDGEPQTGETLIIYGNPAMTQLVDYIAGGTFPAESHEEALDRLTLQSTRSRELVERTPRLMEGDTDGSGQYNANSNRISSLGTPTATTDATTKTYVDALVNNTALGPAPTGLIATGSITSRLLADRWGEVANVKDFGAVGNGVANDTVAIQAAITAARNVYIPQGTYKLTDGSNAYGLLLSTADTTLFGDGPELSLLVYTSSTASQPAIKVTADGVNIIGLSVDGLANSTKAGTVAAANCNGLEFVDVDTCLVQNVHATGGHIGIHLNNSTGAYGTNQHNRVLDCVVRNVASSGVQLTRAEFALVSGCDSKDCGTDGFKMSGKTRQSRVIGNTATLCTRDGFDFYDGFIESVASDNIAEGNTLQGFEIKGTHDGTDYVVRESTFANNLAVFNGIAGSYSGFSISSVRNCTFSGNVATANGGSGYLLNTIQGCTFTGCFASRNVLHGFNLITNVSRTAFTGCYAADNSWAGGTTQNGTYHGFYIADAGSYGTFTACSSINGTTAGQKGGQGYGWYWAAQTSGSVLSDPFANANVTGDFGGASAAFVNNNAGAHGTVTFTASDATPTVATGRTFITAGSTAITDFDNGVDGQVITVRAHGAITLTDSANLQLQGDADFVMAADDTVTLANVGGTNWYETGRRQVSATYTASNVSADRAYDADSTTTAELADVLGTLIADLRLQGIVK